jgi:hypothetical protein
MKMTNLSRLVAAALVLSAGAGAAQECPQWDASGQWTITPEGKDKIALNLKQNGPVISGTADRRLSSPKSRPTANSTERPSFSIRCRKR